LVGNFHDPGLPESRPRDKRHRRTAGRAFSQESVEDPQSDAVPPIRFRGRRRVVSTATLAFANVSL
jgi:hypothetical protein